MFTFVLKKNEFGAAFSVLPTVFALLAMASILATYFVAVS